MSLPSIFSSALSAGAFFAPARTARRIALTGLIMASPPTLCADYTQGFGVDLYGRSYHHNLPAGERDKLNEANIGFAVNSRIESGLHVGLIEVGAWDANSFHDKTYWLGAQYRYRLHRYVEPGLMARHWETERGTYPDTAVSKYFTVSVPVTDRARVTTIIGESTLIWFVGLDF